MHVDQASLDDLKRISLDSFGRKLSDAQAQEIAQRIIRFLVNSDDDLLSGYPNVDAD